ncbi:HAMP domain-containing protein, partial [Rhizobium skierniewicense]
MTKGLSVLAARWLTHGCGVADVSRRFARITLRGTMSFLQNAKVRTKILSLIVPVALLGLIGLGVVSNNYSTADDAYSDILSKNVVASTELFRANTALVSIGYDATLGLMMREQSADTAKVEEAYKTDIATTKRRLDTAKTLLPELAGPMNDLSGRVDQIVAMTDKIWESAKAGDFQSGRKMMTAVNPLIDKWRSDIRVISESNLALVASKSDDMSAQTSSTITTTLIALGVLFAAAIALALFVSARGITSPIDRLRARMVSLANGETQAEVDGLNRRDEVGQMAEAVAVFRNNALERIRLEQEADANRSLSEKERIAREEQKAKEAADTSFAVDHLADALSRLADGEVSYRISQPFVQHLDVVRANFNSSAEKLQSALNSVAVNARGIDAGANEIRAAADDLAKRTEQQAASVEETAAA